MKKGCHVSVRVSDEENIEKAIKKFSRKVKKSGVIEAFRRKLYFRSPGELRREKRRNAQHYLKKKTDKGDKE